MKLIRQSIQITSLGATRIAGDFMSQSGKKKVAKRNGVPKSIVRDWENVPHVVNEDLELFNRGCIVGLNKQVYDFMLKQALEEMKIQRQSRK